jgi:hypothetical protein
MVYVPDKGLEFIPKYVGQSTVGKFAWLALDHGATVEAAGTTALTDEVTLYGGERMLGTVSYEASFKEVIQGTFAFTGIGAGVPYALKGCGWFDQLALGGNPLEVHAFAADKNVEDDESLQVTMKLAFAR